MPANVSQEFIPAKNRYAFLFITQRSQIGILRRDQMRPSVHRTHQVNGIL